MTTPKGIDVECIVLSIHAGVPLYRAQADALMVAATNETSVMFTFNDIQYRIDYAKVMETCLTKLLI